MLRGVRTRFGLPVLAVGVALLLAGCGSSITDPAAAVDAAAADARACREALRVVSLTEKMLKDSAGYPDLEQASNLADMLGSAADAAEGEMKGVIDDAASALSTWVDGAMRPEDDGSIPLYVDEPMWKLKASCEAGEQ
jgi:hypothetical protein